MSLRPRKLGYPTLNLQCGPGSSPRRECRNKVIDVLVPAVEKAFKDPEVIKRATKMGMESLYMGPEELRKSMASEIQVIKGVAEEAGMVANRESCRVAAVLEHVASPDSFRSGEALVFWR